MSDFDTEDYSNLEVIDTSNTTTDNHALIEFVVHGVLLSCVAIAGLVSNIICLITLCRPLLRQGQGSVNIILATMAAIDIVVVLSALLMCGFPGLAMYSLLGDESDASQVDESSSSFQEIFLHAVESMLPYTTPYVYPVGLMAQTASVYLTVLVTVERFIVVCHPLKARSLCTTKRTRLGVILVLSFSILYNITRFFEYTYHTSEVREEFYSDEEDPELLAGNITAPMNMTVVPGLQITSLRRDPLYVAIYINWMYLITMYVVPFILLLSLNWKIGREIRLATIRRKKMTQSKTDQLQMRPLTSVANSAGIRENDREKRAREREEKEQQKLSLMLMVVVMVFMSFNVLAMIVNIMETFNIRAADLTLFSNLFVTLNSSINLFIYCAFGEKFRKELKKIICCTKQPSQQDTGEFNSQYGVSQNLQNTDLKQPLCSHSFNPRGSPNI